MQSKVNEKVKETTRWIEKNYRAKHLTDETNLISSRILDSLGIARLAHYVESLIEQELPVEEMKASNFNSINAIRALFTRYLE